MSDLESIFDVHYGWPSGSALAHDFKVADGVTVEAGHVVSLTTDSLVAASALRMVDDSLTAAPTLVAGDAGAAYEIADRQLADAAVLKIKDDAQVTAPSAVTGEAHEVAGTGGAWSTFTIGDIVEYDGAAWNLVVAQSGGNPPDGTRAVVIDTGAAGSFAGGEEKVFSCTGGTWTAVDTPLDTELITIDGTNSIYDTQIWEYTGTHATGSWGLSTDDWRTFDDGSIVEWSGTAWALTVAPVTGDPPDGTRVVVVEASAAGSFAGQEEEVWAISSGTWSAATAAPADGAKIDIVAANSIYYGNRYEYVGTHPAGAWTYLESGMLSLEGFVNLMTSVAVAGAKTSAWLVIEGDDQFDGDFVGRVTAVKIASGAVFKVKTAVANTLNPGDYVEAGSGLFVKCDGTNHALGQVQWSNGVTGTGGEIIVTGI
jgi:hypothetical protein